MELKLEKKSSKPIKKYVIFHRDEGLFLGFYENKPVFSLTDSYGSTKAVCFLLKNDAFSFAANHQLFQTVKEYLEIVEIEVPGYLSEDQYVSYVYLAKNKLNPYTANMLMIAEPENQTIH